MLLCESRGASHATSAGQPPFWSRASATPPPTHPAGWSRFGIASVAPAGRTAPQPLIRASRTSHIWSSATRCRGARSRADGIGLGRLEDTTWRRHLKPGARTAPIPSAPRRGIVADTVKSFGTTRADTVRPRTLAGSLGPFGGARRVGTASASRSPTEAVRVLLRYFSVGPIWPLMRPVGWKAQRHGSLSVSTPVPNRLRPVAGPATPGRPGSS